MSKRLFISKNASEIEPYRSQFDELGYSVVSHSFLSFYPVESDPFSTELKHEYDVLFFGSPRAVIFFKASQSISKDVVIACVGGKTAELLESLGHEVAFVGTKSGEPKVVGEEFKVWLTSTALSPSGSRRVLFPISDRSLKTISGVISEDQKEELVVYSTEVVGRAIEECDVYVFTSPSNVEGYLIDNVIPETASVIAWGKSTENALIERGVKVGACLERSGFEELLVYLR